MIINATIAKGSKITMKDGSYKSVEDIVIGDEVQTYNMTDPDFDAANIKFNEQLGTKVVSCGKSVEDVDLVKITLESISYDNYGDKIIDTNTLVIDKRCLIMGGSGFGWLATAINSLSSDLTDTLKEIITEKVKPLEVDKYVSADSDKSLEDQKIISIEEVSEVETYCIDELENGDSIFVNDVMVGVEREDSTFNEDLAERELPWVGE